MNSKSPLSIPNFIGSGSASRPQSPSLCSIPNQENVTLCGCQQAPKSQWASAFGVLVLVLAYTALGSVLFVSLEGEVENGDMVETSVAASKPYPRHDLPSAEMRHKTVDRLWSITEDLNILYKENWTRLAAQEVLHFQDTILRAVRASRTQQVTNVQQNTRPYKWTYASAFLYSLTLITTIGFSGISPRTQWGRVAALIYALFGIPIILLYLSAIGESLSNGMRFIFRRLKPFRTSQEVGNSGQSIGNVNVTVSGKNSSSEVQKRSQLYHQTWNHSATIHDPHTYALNTHGLRKSKINHFRHPQSVVPISICVMILICYVTFGAVLFHKIQPWGVLESLYFCFTSLGTIGFGDLMPKGNLAQYTASAYIIIGMAVVAMCFSLIQTELIIWLKKFAIPEPSTTEDVALVSATMTPVKS
ncbi:TWiK family of potassium channels protein 18 isoform X1 [Anopheles aquasalis]|uniref:TWiK family of potassium channels protein 18 isoform X1 n=1 Tax=Anopheles aquasalis TaxID=42839 RepID=UPI00215AB098|nr:TWiK family of potassium channels protein 18 isoform X1 [Anopheles aquasalis]XP_050091927.1 TWiK family of potassium channels protein 18 isoform X1 [Anopheles aquasalis]XP_050091928.1 TWiK family of potassium channels protein 18 isoform X1 [Anopheles aquasalis]XP_050091929.1 TWiK family of potassium channels protein 18 isoform X1 [Anopheles aquasalis]